MPKNFQEVVRLIVQEDTRYDSGAYYLLREGLDATIRAMKTARAMRNVRHITGQELAEGLRKWLLEQYGPMAKTLLETWGIHSTEDFGHIVFTLVDYGILAKNESDTIDDFKDIYDFATAFEYPFLSTADRRARERKRKRILREAKRAADG